MWRISHITLQLRSSWDCLKVMCRSQYYCHGTERSCRPYAVRSGNKRLWCIITRSAVLCRTICGSECAAKLLYAKTKVGSAVIRLTKYKDAPIKVTNEKLLFQLIRASFNQRRKTLQNGIKNFGGLNFSKEQVAQALEEMELPASVRGEALTLEQFAQLSNILDR